MTVVPYTIISNSEKEACIEWTGLAGSNTGQPMQFNNLTKKSVQVFGTIGAAITIQGSNDPNVPLDYQNNTSNATWVTATDPAGNALSYSSAGGGQILQSYKYFRPNCASGTTNATVIIEAQK